MSTSDRAAVIDRKTADRVCRALRLMWEEWLLPPEVWEEIAELLDELSAAVAAGNATAVKALANELEVLSGSRVAPIGEDPRDGKVPVPERERERAVALVHLLDPDPAPDGPRPVPSERT